MNPLNKAVAVVSRVERNKRQILLFEHPVAGVQLPKGTVEVGESISKAVTRELWEETGLKLGDPVEFAQMAELSNDGDILSHWHFFHFDGQTVRKTSWVHRPVGGSDEEGLVFRFFWSDVENGLHNEVHPIFNRAYSVVQDNFRESSPK